MWIASGRSGVVRPDTLVHISSSPFSHQEQLEAYWEWAHFRVTRARVIFFQASDAQNTWKVLRERREPVRQWAAIVAIGLGALGVCSAREDDRQPMITATAGNCASLVHVKTPVPVRITSATRI